MAEKSELLHWGRSYSVLLLSAGRSEQWIKGWTRHCEHWIKGWVRHCRSTVDREGVSEGSLRDSMCEHVEKAGVG